MQDIDDFKTLPNITEEDDVRSERKASEIVPQFRSLAAQPPRHTLETMALIAQALDDAIRDRQTVRLSANQL